MKLCAIFKTTVNAELLDWSGFTFGLFQHSRYGLCFSRNQRSPYICIDNDNDAVILLGGLYIKLKGFTRFCPITDSVELAILHSQLKPHLSSDMSVICHSDSHRVTSVTHSLITSLVLNL